MPNAQPLFPNGKWLLCLPTFFTVAYEINPWMKVSVKPLGTRAATQWKNLHHTLLRLGAWVEYIDPQNKHPDMVFTANAGLVKNNKFVLSKFRHPERQGEAVFFKEWFERRGYEVAELEGEGTFEGEGDALFAPERDGGRNGDLLFVGTGFRSDQSVYAQVEKLLDVKKVVICELTNPRFYHLDTCFCPLNPTQAIYYPKAFSEESKKRMSESIELFPVCEEDAAKFACNAVVLGNDVIIPGVCNDTADQLKKLGYTAHQVELDEFLKAGGAAKCLCIRID